MKLTYFLLSVIGFTSLLNAGMTQAQPNYPNKPINLVVPQAAGGTNDIVARLIAPAFGEALDGSVVVENKPGAGGNIGTQGVIMAAALLVSLPTIILYFLTQRHFIRGIALSGIK